MNELQIFSYEGKEVRTVEKNSEVWWVLKDVCNALEIGNSRMVADRLDDDEKGVSITDTPGGKQELTVISESGLYNVILLSRKPEAKKFKRWVTHEVLPSIRKYGAYMTQATIDRVLADPDFGIRLLTQLKAEKAKNAELTALVSAKNQQIAEMKPKASYYDVILNCKDAVAISVIAKDYGKSGKWLNKYLHKLGIQFKQGNIWLLYQKYAEKGFTCTKTHSYLASDRTTHSNIHTYWTQKGRIFIYELLKAHGVLPLIEQGMEAEVV
ncbi:hypothetical protein SCACP_25960 [Sporomusa carbonis]